MTDKEKRESGFVESDFLGAAGLFLKERGISAKRIIVENAIECSSPDGMAFQARLEKQDGYSFQFILFRSLPGEYVFTLQKLDAEVESETLATETSVSQGAGQSMNQASASGQTQTAPVVLTQTSVANDYDATGLSISSVPEELLNYLDNEYVFQYSLYDYLYRNGKKEISSARVTDYTWQAIIGNTDVMIYLGGNEPETHKYMTEMLGKYTLDKRSSGESLGSHGSSSRNYDVVGRELMTPDEVRRMSSHTAPRHRRGSTGLWAEYSDQSPMRKKN